MAQSLPGDHRLTARTSFGRFVYHSALWLPVLFYGGRVRGGTRKAFNCGPPLGRRELGGGYGMRKVKSGESGVIRFTHESVIVFFFHFFSGFFFSLVCPVHVSALFRNPKSYPHFVVLSGALEAIRRGQLCGRFMCPCTNSSRRTCKKSSSSQCAVMYFPGAAF